MINTPICSVIIPVWNQAQYLPEAIESILNQTVPVNVIVVNDGSPDNASEVARHYPVQLIEQTNKGLAGARNSGIKAATTPYVLCLDADDKLSPDCIERLLEHAAPNMIVIPGMKMFGESEMQNTAWPPFTKETLLMSNRIHCASLYSKESWEKVNGYDESEIMRTGYEDWDFWLRMIVAGCEATALEGPMFYYRIRPNSMVRSITPEQHTILHNYIKSKHLT